MMQSLLARHHQWQWLSRWPQRLGRQCPNQPVSPDCSTAVAAAASSSTSTAATHHARHAHLSSQRLINHQIVSRSYLSTSPNHYYDNARGRGDRDNNRRGPYRKKEIQLNEHGHDYTQVGDDLDSSICIRSPNEIHALLRKRMHCKLSRDFEQADNILDELETIGVQVNDKVKQWRAIVLNEHGHEYRQVEGTTIDPRVCTLTEKQIHQSIRERMHCRHARNYRDADSIERRLRRFGVEVCDRAREWRADGVRMVSSRLEMNKFGHIYEQVGGPIDPRHCTLRREEIHDMIRERMHAKLKRDFGKADTIQDRLRAFGVDMDDKTKEWRADGETFRRIATHDRKKHWR